MTPGYPDRTALLRRLGGSGDSVVTIEVGAAPMALHRAAMARPGPWLEGAGGLLVHAGAGPAAQALEGAFQPRWAAAFPGLSAPRLWT
jgi:hypothetical protein